MSPANRGSASMVSALDSSAQVVDDNHKLTDGSNPPPTHGIRDVQDGRGGGWVELRIWAEMFHDMQKHRIASENRACLNWKEPRLGVDPDVYRPHLELLEAAEHSCKLELVRCYRRVAPESVWNWQQDQPGLGEHLVARLLGHLGHPRIATPYSWYVTPPAEHECDKARCGENRHLVAGQSYERSLHQLWAYCGHGDPRVSRRTRGVTQDEAMAGGSPTLKLLVHLNAEACMQAGVRRGEADLKFTPDTRTAKTRYGLVYLDRRKLTFERLHEGECVRCGPSGKPAVPGSPWSAGHQQADALRIVGKEILRDLWTAAA